MENYKFLISKWTSQDNVPLAPRLKPYEEPRLKSHTLGIQILHAASKLSLQLWVQNSEIKVIDDIVSRQSVVHLLDFIDLYIADLGVSR